MNLKHSTKTYSIPLIMFITGFIIFLVSFLRWYIAFPYYDVDIFIYRAVGGLSIMAISYVYRLRELNIWMKKLQEKILEKEWD